MPTSSKYLIIASIEAYSGKSAMGLGLALQLKQRGIEVSYGKPVATFPSATDDGIDEDVAFVAKTLNLAADRLYPSLLFLDEQTIQARMMGTDTTDYQAKLAGYHDHSPAGVVILEGPSSLIEGRLFGLSLPEMAQILDAQVILVARFNSLSIAESLQAAKAVLGDRLLGVVVNDVPKDQLETVRPSLTQYLEQVNIPVLGMLPSNVILRSVSVAELVQRLSAEVLCRPDRLDLLVESLTIGAMNVNSALKYFRKAQNMAVVTGGDRADIQMAALETSTQCLILTGHLPPAPEILSRAEDLEVPILSVDLDTLTTVEIIDHAFGQVRLHEPIKVQCIQDMIRESVDVDRLISHLSQG